MKKFGYILFTAVFFLICIVPLAGMIVKGPAPAAKPDMGKLDALGRFGNIKFE